MKSFSARFLWHLPPDAAFVIAGAKMAPRNQKTTAIVLTLFGLLFSLMTHVISQHLAGRRLGITNFMDLGAESAGALWRSGLHFVAGSEEPKNGNDFLIKRVITIFKVGALRRFSEGRRCSPRAIANTSLERDLALALALGEIVEDFLDVAFDATDEHLSRCLRNREEGAQFTFHATTHVLCPERSERAQRDRALQLAQGLTAFNPSRDLLGNLLNISAKLGQHGLSFLDGSVSRNDAFKLERLECLQRGRPLVGKAVPHVRKKAMHQVTRRDHALRGNEGDDVARGVPRDPGTEDVPLVRRGE